MTPATADTAEVGTGAAPGSPTRWEPLPPAVAGGPRLVYEALETLANTQGAHDGTAAFRIAELQDLTGLSAVQVGRILNALELDGHIIRQRGNRARKSQASPTRSVQ